MDSAESPLECLEKEGCSSPWHADDVEVPEFDGMEVLNNESRNEAMLAAIMRTGLAYIRNMPRDADRDKNSGNAVINWLSKTIGRPYKHPTRTPTDRFLLSIEHNPNGIDERQRNDVMHFTEHPMHTDASYDHQFLVTFHQVAGESTSRYADGAAIFKYMQEHHPKELKLLTSQYISNGLRHRLYSESGAARPDLADWAAADVNEFEHIRRYRVFDTDPQGRFQKITLGDPRRTALGIQFDLMNPYSDAYNLLMKLRSHPRFVKEIHWQEGDAILVNNRRVLHGRGLLKPGTRTLTGTYHDRSILERRYRTLVAHRLQKFDDLAAQIQFSTRNPDCVVQSILALRQN